jgi:hypothetical protein
LLTKKNFVYKLGKKVIFLLGKRKIKENNENLNEYQKVSRKLCRREGRKIRKGEYSLNQGKRETLFCNCNISCYIEGKESVSVHSKGQWLCFTKELNAFYKKGLLAKSILHWTEK